MFNNTECRHQRVFNSDIYDFYVDGGNDSVDNRPLMDGFLDKKFGTLPPFDSSDCAISTGAIQEYGNLARIPYKKTHGDILTMCFTVTVILEKCHNHQNEHLQARVA